MGAYTTIDDPSAYFLTQLYTGTGSSHSVTNDANAGNFKPDWVWIKERSSSGGHKTYDSTRGVQEALQTQSSAGETTTAQGLTAFNTDGFTVGSDGGHNQSSATYVAWQWKAAGGTTASNSNGSITSTVQANTTAGFSIVTYTGDGATSATVGHGLGAVPKMIISKDRDGTSNVPHWRIYHEGIGNTKYLQLNGTGVATTFDDWGNTTPTSTVYTIGGSGGYRPTNTSSKNYGAYVFAEKQGYSKFGSYIGNENANGTFVYTGFKPALIIIKNTGVVSNWRILDSKRLGYNKDNNRMSPNTSTSEETDDQLDILSNGFKMITTDSEINSGYTHIYMAFAENPFVTSTGIPTTAR